MEIKNYKIKGIVIKGQQLGRTIGYPTANLQIKEQLPIDQGVYLVRVKLKNDSQLYWGMADYWTNPRTGLTFETFIFDFDQEIYGQEIVVTLVSFYRENIKINNLADLKEQLLADEKALRKLIINE